MAKTATCGITRSHTVTGVVTVVEPLVNTVMRCFFDRCRGHPKVVAARKGLTGLAPRRVAGTRRVAHFSTKARSIT